MCDKTPRTCHDPGRRPGSWVPRAVKGLCSDDGAARSVAEHRVPGPVGESVPVLVVVLTAHEVAEQVLAVPDAGAGVAPGVDEGAEAADELRVGDAGPAEQDQGPVAPGLTDGRAVPGTVARGACRCLRRSDTLEPPRGRHAVTRGSGGLGGPDADGESGDRDGESGGGLTGGGDRHGSHSRPWAPSATRTLGVDQATRRGRRGHTLVEWR